MGADRAPGRVAILPALTALAIVVVLIAPRPAATDEKAPTPAELWEWLIHFTNYAGYPKAGK